MTDKEIIKALEICTFNNRSCGDCLYKPETEDGAICMDRLLKDALDLINRQQIAIKEFQKTISKLHEEIADLEAEIDKQYEQAVADIKGNIANGGTSCHWCIDRNKEEAIKDFAEKLKEIAEPFVSKENGLYLLSTQDIKDILEMVGADNDT